jgi:hypothetical protein
MKNYKYVLEWTDNLPDEKIIYDCLDYAWRYTPSKNNFMNYNVHVLGPNQWHLRELLYYKCLSNQSKANGNKITKPKLLKKYETHLLKINQKPQFWNVKYAPYVLIYTHRVVTELNQKQKMNISQGMIYEQTFPVGTKKYEKARLTAQFEAGMFAANFSSKCLENNIDTSFIACIPTSLDEWSEPEWDFVNEQPFLLQLAGFGDMYKRDTSTLSDLKPNFEKVVNVL